MPQLNLYPHEQSALQSTGQVLVVRMLDPQPPSDADYGGMIDATGFASKNTVRFLTDTNRYGYAYHKLPHAVGDLLFIPEESAGENTWGRKVEVTKVDVFQVQEITDINAESAGMVERSKVGDNPTTWRWTWPGSDGWRSPTPRSALKDCWLHMNTGDAWSTNPWVSAITVKEVGE